MANKIVLKKSSVAAKVPVAGDLDFGELAINYTDGKLYFKKADNTIDAFTTAAASAPVTSVGGNIGDITDAQLLASIKNVDGTGSGLDADTLDGNHASAFYLASNPNGYTSNTGTVTSVGATAPLVSSGGTAPSISIPAANSTTNGYMSSAYASKLDGIAAGATANTGTVTSVSGTGGYGGLTLSGTITSSGSLTLGGTPTGTWPISITGSAATVGTIGTTQVTTLYSPNGATVVSPDTASAMPAQGQLFIHTLGTGPSANDGQILGMSWANTTSVYGAQIWLDTDPTNRMAIRSRSSAGVWNGWSEVLTSNNYTSYSPSLTGSGASGTWGISITGSAASATTSSQVTINYNNDSNSTYQMLWGSGNSVYGTAGIYCNPSTDIIYASQVQATSDESVKTNWRDIDSDFVYKLATAKIGIYDRTDIELTQAGVSAQSWQKILPETVLNNQDGLLSVNYGNAALVSAVKLAEKVVEQEKRIEELEKLVKELINKL